VSGSQRLIGVRDDRANRRAVRAIGAREIAAGLGILMGVEPTSFLWTRVGGDLTELALLTRLRRTESA